MTKGKAYSIMLERYDLPSLPRQFHRLPSEIKRDLVLYHGAKYSLDSLYEKLRGCIDETIQHYVHDMLNSHECEFHTMYASLINRNPELKTKFAKFINDIYDLRQKTGRLDQRKSLRAKKEALESCYRFFAERVVPFSLEIEDQLSERMKKITAEDLNYSYIG